MQKLDELRHKIDEIDNKIMDLVNDRMSFVKEIGELKRSGNETIYRPEREKAIIDRLAADNKGVLSRTAIEAIFMEIFAVSRNPNKTRTRLTITSRLHYAITYCDIILIFILIPIQRSRLRPRNSKDSLKDS